MKITLRQILVVIAVLAVIVVNSLANIVPFNGQTTGEVSDNLSNYFVPAGYVFSIWGLIYLGLVVYAIFQGRSTEINNSRLKAVSGWFLLSSVANIVWLLFWHYNQFILTVPVMLVLLASIIKIYLILRRGNPQISRGEFWAVRVPFSIYLGWITVATVANLTDVLYYLNWNGFGISAVAWMSIILLAVLVIVALVNFTRRDIGYTLVILWALIGIGLKHAAVSAVAIPTWITFGLVALSLVAAFFTKKGRAKA